MTIALQGSPEFGWILPTATGQPAAAFGTSVTPGQNAYGSYAELIDGALVTSDVEEVDICFNSVTSNGAERSALFRIGIDQSAGTSYATLISGLLGTSAAAFASANGLPIWYRFPIRIPAGSSIAVCMSRNVSVASAPTTSRCFMVLRGRPTHPRQIYQPCAYVRTYGETLATSEGTAVTPGTTDEGAWTQLGTIGAGDLIRYWELGVGVRNAAMTANVMFADLAVGDASNKRIVLQDVPIPTMAAECLVKGIAGAWGVASPGDIVYGRLQSAGTPDSGVTMCAYGAGGFA